MTPPVTWPSALVGEVAARRFVVVLGARAQTSSTNTDGNHPPSWAGLVEDAAAPVPGADDRRAAEELMRRGAYPDSAQVFWAADPARGVRAGQVCAVLRPRNCRARPTDAERRRVVPVLAPLHRGDVHLSFRHDHARVPVRRREPRWRETSVWRPRGCPTAPPPEYAIVRGNSASMSRRGVPGRFQMVAARGLQCVPGLGAVR